MCFDYTLFKTLMLYFTLTFYRNTKNRINCLGKIQSNINIYYIVKLDKGLYRMPGFLLHTYILNIFLATHIYIYIGVIMARYG